MGRSVPVVGARVGGAPVVGAGVGGATGRSVIGAGVGGVPVVGAGVEDNNEEELLVAAG